MKMTGIARITPASFKTKSVGLTILAAVLAAAALPVCEGGMVADRPANIDPVRFRRRAKSSKASRSKSSKKSSGSGSGDSKSSKSDDGSSGVRGESSSGKASKKSGGGGDSAAGEDVAGRLVSSAMSLEGVVESIESNGESSDSRGVWFEQDFVPKVLMTKTSKSGKESKSEVDSGTTGDGGGDGLVPAMFEMDITAEPTTSGPITAGPTTAWPTSAGPTNLPTARPSSSSKPTASTEATRRPSSSNRPSYGPTMSFEMPSDSFVLDGTVPLDQRLPTGSARSAETSPASSVLLLLASAALAWAIRP